MPSLRSIALCIISTLSTFKLTMQYKSNLVNISIASYFGPSICFCCFLIWYSPRKSFFFLLNICLHMFITEEFKKVPALFFIAGQCSRCSVWIKPAVQCRSGHCSPVQCSSTAPLQQNIIDKRSLALQFIPYLNNFIITKKKCSSEPAFLSISIIKN